MANFLLTSPDCVFIHIHKTGGQSIRYGVWGGVRLVEPAFGIIPEQWMSLFKFAFVRHPLDRFISAWKMYSEGSLDSQNRRSKGTQKLRVREHMSVEDFATIVFDEKTIYDERRKTFEERVRHHTIPQTHPFNCLRFADFVGRFESIDSDFDVIRRRLGITKPLPKLNHTLHAHWSDYLKGNLLDRCIAYYEQDMRELGYDA
jgi:hypothetical protein